MTLRDDPQAFRAALEAKMQPARIRATLGFAGLYQMTHEMIKYSVIDQVREFFMAGFDSTGTLYDEDKYRSHVLARAPKSKFRASLLWLVDSEAITLAQADRLDDIYDHRHDLSHELIKYIVDPAFEPDMTLLADAYTILTAIRRFQPSIDADIGMFEEHGDIDVTASVRPLSTMVLNMCIDAYVEGLEDSR